MDIKTTIHIEARPEQVWQVLTDFDRYPEWNTFVQSLTGEVKEGNRIRIVLPGMTFRPRVIAFRRNEELRWLGHLLFKGLFDGEHYFRLTKEEDGTTTVAHGEHFRGLLVPLFKKQLLKDTKQGFEAMNQQLKQQVEKKHLQ